MAGFLDLLVKYALNEGAKAVVKKFGLEDSVKKTYDRIEDNAMKEHLSPQEYAKYKREKVHEKVEAEREKRAAEYEAEIEEWQSRRNEYWDSLMSEQNIEDGVDNDVNVTPNDICGIVEYAGTASEITSKEYIALWENLLTEHSEMEV